MEVNTKQRFLIGLTLFLTVLISGCQSNGNQVPSNTAAVTSAPTLESIAATSIPAEASATPGPLAQANQPGSFFAINEILLGPDGYVALTNFTDVAVAIGGLYLCQGSECFALPDAVVEAGETVLVAAGDGAGFENVVATEATFGELRPVDGEIALYSSTDLEDPTAILIYFQWGSTPHALTATAIDAGQWVEGGYGPTGENAVRLFRVEESGLWLWEQ